MSTENRAAAAFVKRLPVEELVLPATVVGGDLGTFYADFTLWSNDGTRSHTLNGLVDTGAFYPQVPALILEDLGIEREFSEVFRLADGTKLELDVGQVRIELEGQRRSVYAVFGPAGSSTLLGALALEIFALAIHARNEKFIPADLPL
ncbi:MAG: hypothetical protein F4X65_02165 [Chloroflexi bacterium]|nr:hypothetical protein [Chloroflexota bacterium]